MLCGHIMDSTCPAAGHRQQWQCNKGPPLTCVKCERDKAIAEKKKQEEFALQQKRDEDQRKHAQRIAEIEDQIARERDILRDAQLVEEREQAILQKKKDLQDVAQLAAQASQPPPPLRVASPAGLIPPPPMNTASTQPVVPQEKSAMPSTSVQAPTSRGNGKAADLKPLIPKPPKSSAARERWQRQKDLEGASNDAIDAIMAMTGLEEVKEQVLRIKDKVETSQLQGSSVKSERFNVCMLGNPGTGTHMFCLPYKRPDSRIDRENDGCEAIWKISCIRSSHPWKHVRRNNWV
jgi:hypothetical protein